METIYSFKTLSNKGAEVELSQYKGKVLMIVNTASKCGFTPQYKALEELYQKYHDRGLEILDFPCNQFGHQAPGDESEIHAFCTAKYKTTFDQLAKIEVNGAGADPFFAFLKAAKPEDDDPAEDTPALRELLAKHGLSPEREPGLIEWNFTKFLIDRSGAVVKRSGPKTDPSALAPCIEALLA